MDMEMEKANDLETTNELLCLIIERRLLSGKHP
jgi:hypothetical protein